MKRTVVILSGLGLVVLASCWASLNLLEIGNGRIEASGDNNVAQAIAQPNQPVAPSVITPPEKVFRYANDGSELKSRAVMIYDAKLSKIVFAKNADVQLAPASLTKIMTALVVIENLPDLDQKFVVKNTTLDYMRSRQASLAGFYAGEAVSVRDLLYGTMLASGGEASMTLAEGVSGTVADFVALMNQTVARLGLAQTYFATTEGLDVEGQVTTAGDMIKLLNYALKNPTFREIFTTMEYRTTSLNRPLLIKDTIAGRWAGDVAGYQLVGSKTGTTSAAGVCLASLVKNGDRELLVVTLGAPLENWPQPLPHHIDDLRLILQNLSLE